MQTRLSRRSKSWALAAAALMLVPAGSAAFAQQQLQQPPNSFSPNPPSFNSNSNGGNQNFSDQNGGNRNSGNQTFNDQNGGNQNFGNQQHPADVPMTHYTGREHGSLGVTLSDNDHGDVWVATVVPTSPADRAGLRPGDQILAFDNQPIHSYREAVHAINLKGPYDRMVVHVRRNGQQGALTAALMPHQAPGDNPAGMQTGYFQHPQHGTMHTYVGPMQSYTGTPQPTFNNASSNGAQGYNQNPQQNGNQQQNGNNGSGFQPFTVLGPPLRHDLGNDQGIQPTGPSF